MKGTEPSLPVRVTNGHVGGRSAVIKSFRRPDVSFCVWLNGGATAMQPAAMAYLSGPSCIAQGTGNKSPLKSTILSFISETSSPPKWGVP